MWCIDTGDTWHLYDGMVMHKGKSSQVDGAQTEGQIGSWGYAQVLFWDGTVGRLYGKQVTYISQVELR